MCGFVVFFEPNRKFSQKLLLNLGNDIIHRGPDSEGYLNELGIGGVFRRLSIIDPTIKSDQPMTRGKITIFFNGEIYNYKKLKSELISQNVNFDTNGDTEVILNGYRKHGLIFLKKLVGMFSIVIIDRYLNKAIVLRDPIGIKPLYIHKNKNFIGISSEVKPLLRACKPQVDIEALKELLVFGWAAGKFSNYKDIDLLMPGTLLEINLKNSFIKEETYENIFDYNKISYPDILEIGELIDKSIQDHTMSDVGYSLQLSGGVDSSYIAAFCAEKSEKKLRAFSICIDDENLNEERFQKIVAQKYNLDYYKVNFSGQNYAEELPSAVKHMEGPTPHGGCVAIKFLNKEITKFSKVVLTGEGADELFGGYGRYQFLEYFRFIKFIKKFIPQNLIPNIYPFKTLNKYKNTDPIIFSSVNHNFENLWSTMPEIIPLPGHRDKISSKFTDILDKLRSVDQSSYLSSLLIRQDKLSMAHSVEARVPFTHLPLYRKINNLKINSNYFKKQTKPILKQIAKKKLPSELVFRRKNGLLSPYGKWLSDVNGAGAYLDFLDNSNSQIKSYLDEKRFKKFLLKTKKDINKNQGILRKLIEIELWLRSIKLPDGELLNP